VHSKGLTLTTLRENGYSYQHETFAVDSK